MLNINGSWGSGKSSLLNLIKRELLNSEPYSSSAIDKWIIVDYNAWQNQRIHPSWWSLMNIVYNQSICQLKSQNRKLLPSLKILKIQLFENIWRLKARNFSVFITLLTISIVLVLLSFFILRYGWPISPDSDLTKGITGVVPFIISIFTGIFGLRQSLIPGSKDAAENFVQLTSDPMEKLSTHFERLIEKIRSPVAIFIDDLDRCNEAYTVEFLEQIQTVLRKPNLIILIAADRHWIVTSYEKIYSTFKPIVEKQPSLGYQQPSLGYQQPSLGYQFLEKIFQLSVTIPYMTKDQQEQYWEKLIKIMHTANKKKSNELNDENEHNTKNKSANAKMQQKQPKIANLQRIRELNKPEMESKTANLLSPYSYLLEPNPRAMKRLINAYGVMRDKSLLRGGEPDKKVNELVRWTIANMRWPVLAEYLADHPDMIENAYDDKNRRDLIPKKLQGLFRDKAVQNVINGIDKDTIVELGIL